MSGKMAALSELELKSSFNMSLIPCLISSAFLYQVLMSEMSNVEANVANSEMLINLKVFIFFFVFNFYGLMGGVSILTVWPFTLLVLSSSLWMSVIFFSISSNKEQLVSHFTPENLSLTSSIPMTIIELVGFLMRPLTLGMRLCANVAGGHLITELLEEMGGGLGSTMVIHIYESFVSLMQAFIFTLLLLNYYKEVK